jgi:hypothetical protein
MLECNDTMTGAMCSAMRARMMLGWLCNVGTSGYNDFCRNQIGYIGEIVTCAAMKRE